MTLPILHLTGTPYEQGLAQGRELRGRVAHNVAVYFDRFQQETKLARDEVLRRARLYAPAIQAQNADYYAGMQGIADGSGFAFDEIVAINVRYEILYYQFKTLAMEEVIHVTDGCTAFAVNPAGTTTNHLIMGQNWDWIPDVQGAVLHTTEANGLATLSFTEAGIFGGKIGLNSVGIGLAVNGMTTTADDWTTLDKPFHLRAYEVLRQNTFADAVEVITGSGRGCSANYLIAQTPDHVADVEAAPPACNTLSWQGSCLVHTNHFVDPAGLGITEPPSDFKPRSHTRYNRMAALLEANLPVSVDTMKHLLQDHANAPASLCRHGDPERDASQQYHTVTSVIMDLHERVLHITDKQPCQNPYQAFHLN